MVALALMYPGALFLTFDPKAHRSKVKSHKDGGPLIVATLQWIQVG